MKELKTNAPHRAGVGVGPFSPISADVGKGKKKKGGEKDKKTQPASPLCSSLGGNPGPGPHDAGGPAP